MTDDLRIVLAIAMVAALLAIAPRCGAQEAPAPSGDYAYRNAARGGIGVGAFLEVAGIGGVGTGMLLLLSGGKSSDGGMALAMVSGGVMTVGGFTSTIAHSVRHQAYRRAGLRPNGHKAGVSWVFTVLSAADYAVALACYFRLMDADLGLGDQIAYLGLWLCATTTSMLMELLNLSLFRVLWRMDMKRRDRDGKPWVAVAPMIDAPGLAVVGVF